MIPRSFVVSVLLGFGSLAGIAHGQQFLDRTSTRFPTQAVYSNQLSFCDVDGDGDLDIAFADGQGYSSAGAALRAKLYINDGQGVFSDESDARIPVTGWFRGVEFGDIDRDGDWDMVLANDFFREPVLLENDGFGFFTDVSDRLPGIPLSSARAQFADVDDDGDVDLAFCHSGTSSRFGSNGRPQLYLNDGTGTFTDATATNTPNAIVRDQQDCLFFDMDNDLDLDLHIGSRSSSGGGSQLWRNDGGVFTRVNDALPTDGATYSYDAADIDGDGDLDLLGANSGTSNRELLILNGGDGTSWTDVSSNILPNPTADDNDSKFIDFDMDGDLDFVIAALGSNTDRFYRNNGSGNFIQTNGIQTSINDSSLDIGFADLDGDGAPDCVTAQGEFGNFQNRIYMNNGPADDIDPTFLAITEIAPSDGDFGPFTVRSLITDQYSSDRGFMPRSVDLLVSVDGSRLKSISMVWVGNSIWEGEIPVLGDCVTVEYRVRAEDRAGNIGDSEVLGFETGGTCGSDADLNGDGFVNGADLGLLLAAWGTRGPGGLNGSGSVTGGDLGLLLAAWTG